MTEAYFALKALHLIAMVAWFGGMFMLARLFAYHVETTVPGDAFDARFRLWERRTLKIICNVGMIVTWVAGLAMLVLQWDMVKSWYWLHAKILFVVLLSAWHGLLARWTRQLASVPKGGSWPRAGRFYRMVGEVPALFLLVIVGLAVFGKAGLIFPT